MFCKIFKSDGSKDTLAALAVTPCLFGVGKMCEGDIKGKAGQVCVWLCYGNQVCFYRIWQPDLVLSQRELK